MIEKTMTEQALDWAVRVSDPSFEEWDAFTTWLEADPGNGEAYELVLAAGDDGDAAVSMQHSIRQPPSVETPVRRWGLSLGGGAAVAAGIAGLLVWHPLRPAADLYLVETAPGVHRKVAMDGVSIAVNGGTRMWLDHRDSRFAKIERGEVLFDVRHDAAHPFKVQVGDAELKDVGTRFDVTRDGRGTRIAVAEGAVVLNPARENLRIDAGRELLIAAGSGTAEYQPASPSTIGGWREGRFAYVETPISIIAADLSRSTGMVFIVDPSVAAKPFTGVVSVDADRKAFIAGLAPLLDVRISQRDGQWVIGRTGNHG